MFDSSLNIITGDRTSGRSIFLLNLAENLQKSGSKVYFVCATNDLKENIRTLKDFVGYDFFSSSESNNLKIIEKVNELIKYNKFNFLLVDDIDYLSSGVIEALVNLPIKKIASSLFDNLCLIKEDFNEYKLINEYNYDLLKNIQTLTNNDNTYLVDDIFNSFSRNEKINTILDDKSR